MNVIDSNPAENLVGLTLDGRWQVIDKISRNDDRTGSAFSIAYQVRDKDSKKIFFLKALDMSSALRADNLTKALFELTSAYEFEKELLKKCISSRMRRVTLIVADGVCVAPGPVGAYNKVPYLVFEMGDNDIREIRARLEVVDSGWILRSLHHSATGIKELHSSGIIHQDLKPSNVVQYHDKTFKIADLGSAWDPSIAQMHATDALRGDPNYAPPELRYGVRCDELARKKHDLYALGGLIFFHFLHESPTIMLMDECEKSGVPCTFDYFEDMDSLQTSFNTCIAKLRTNIRISIPEFADELAIIASELCNPNYKMRGHPRDRAMKSGDSSSLERYVSRFDFMARKFESRLR